MARKDLQNLKRRLSRIKSSGIADAEPEWKYTFRQSLLIKVKTQSMAKIYEQKLAEDLGFFGFVKNWQPRPALMPASIFAIVLFVFFGFSFGTVWASRGSLPGDILFPVKLAIERTQLAAKDKPTEKTMFQAEITNRRAEEIVKLATKEEKDVEKKSEKLEQAVSELKYQLNAVKNDLPKMQKKLNSEDAAQAAKEVIVKLSQVEKSLRQAKDGLADSDKELTERIDSAVELADITSTEALTVVAKRLKEVGSDQSEKKMVLEQVEEKIARTEEKIKSIEEKIGANTEVSADLAKEQSEKAHEILRRAKENLQDEDIVRALETVKTAKEIVLGAGNLASDIEQKKNAKDAEEAKKETPTVGAKSDKEPVKQKEAEPQEEEKNDGAKNSPQSTPEESIEPEQTTSPSLQLTKS